MINGFKEIEYKNYLIKIVYDDFPENPRISFEREGTLICLNSKYDLGDKESKNYKNLTLDEIHKEIKIKYKNAVIVPVYIYDHSGITLSTVPFSCRWDSGQIGFIYYNNEGKKINLNSVKKILESEIKTYNDYLNDNVYGYIVEKNEEFVDSCYGYYGDPEYCESEAKLEVDNQIKIFKEKIENILNNLAVED